MPHGLTVMTNGGGAGVLAADAAARCGIELCALGGSLSARLDATLTRQWSRANPIDIIGDAPAERYVATLEALIADSDTGPILFMHAPTAVVSSTEIARACLPLARGVRHRLLGCWLGDDAVVEARQLFAQAGVADFATPAAAVQACAMLARYRRNQALLTEAPSNVAAWPTDRAAARTLVTGALAAGRLALDDTRDLEPAAEAIESGG